MWSERPISGDSLPAGKLCLTFDDGPGSPDRDGIGPRTVELAEYLAEERIEAAFFVVGRHLLEHPEAGERLVQLGHRVGSHTFDHLRFDSSSASDVRIACETRQTYDLIQRLGVREPILFRPPFGAWPRRLARILNSNALTCWQFAGPVNWDVCGRDYAHWRDGKSPEVCRDSYLAAVRKRRRRNGIVLFHDRTADSESISRRNRTLDLVRLLIPRLRDDGYSFGGLGDVPELKTLLDAGARVNLRSAAGEPVEVRGEIELHLFLVHNNGLADLLSSDGRSLLRRVEIQALNRDFIGFRNSAGKYLGWDSRREEFAGEYPINRPSARFRFTYLGATASADAAPDRREAETLRWRDQFRAMLR